MAHITEAFLGLPEQGFPLTLSNDIKRFGQQDAFFLLALQKNNRVKKLAEYFANNPVRRIFMGADMHGFAYTHPGHEVSYIDREFFNEADPVRRQAKIEQLEGAVVVLNNNDVGRSGGVPNYGDFFNRCERTIFAVWDWDNHHWLDNSTFAAAHADIYVPAHHENLYLLTRYNWCTAGPVYCATIQWPRAFIAEQVAHIATAPRSNDPLGMHVGYPAFNFRNRVVSTLSQKYPSINFSTHSFHNRTLQDRFNEWVAHKAHWIMPVLNDVPIRIFDALISGGIPIVPESMRLLPPVNQISREHILFFTPEDIVAPERIVQQAIRMFDEGGVDGMIERHRYALDHHHASGRIDQILGFVSEKFALPGLLAKR